MVILKEDKHIMFEQYKVLIDSAEKNSDRRISQNNIYLTLNLAFLSFLTITEIKIWFFILMSIIGLLISLIWYLTIDNYSKRNKVKFEIINNFEEHFHELYKEEWKRVELLTPLTKYEKNISIIFALIYVLIIIMNIL